MNKQARGIARSWDSIIILTENFSERNEPHDSIKGRWQPGCNGNKVWSELNVALHSHQQPGLGREKKEEGIRFAWLRLYTKMKSKLSVANKSSVLKTPCPYHLLLEVVQSRLQRNLSGSCSKCSCGDSIFTLWVLKCSFAAAANLMEPNVNIEKSLLKIGLWQKWLLAFTFGIISLATSKCPLFWGKCTQGSAKVLALDFSCFYIFGLNSFFADSENSSFEALGFVYEAL